MPPAPEGRGPAPLAALCLAAALGTVPVACASAHPFDTRFERGEYAAALRALEADSALLTEPRALWRAALIHSMLGPGAYDPEAARARLERLLALAPESEHAAPAAVLLALLDEVDRTRRIIATLRARVDSLSAEAREAVAWNEAFERARPDAEAYDRVGALEELTALLERHPDSRFRPAAEATVALLEELARSRSAVAALQRQLDELKAVDLEDPPD